ncbi:MAG: HAMP domain-containing histidine kinase [Magnetococcales bacterium]|nr:HAMP domain-containing histidine kinase [Magnetococcales bacterium]
MPRLYSYLNRVRLRGKTAILIGLMALGYLFVALIVGRHITVLEEALVEKRRLNQISFFINHLSFDTFDMHLLMSKTIETPLDAYNDQDQLEKLFERKHADIHKTLTDLQKLTTGENALAIDTVREMAQILAGIETSLRRLRELNGSTLRLVREIGPSEDRGVQGSLRGHIHGLEAWLSGRDDARGMVNLLQLRRREKDFLMRSHAESVRLYELAIQGMGEYLEALQGVDSAEHDRIRATFTAYRREAGQLRDLVPLFNADRSELLVVNNDILANTTLLTRTNQQLTLFKIDSLERTLRRTAISLFLSLTVTLLLLGWITFLFFQSLLIPIRLLSNYANRISSGQYGVRISLYGKDEIGELAACLQKMKESMLDQQRVLEHQVQRRTEHLEITNAVLQETIQQLNETHRELLHSEKMASLGRLVAGFAHEINTPIGIAITTISNLPELTRYLNEMLSRDEVDEEELQATLNQLQQTADLGLSSLKRAANLVTRFKRTSADQASEEARTFNIQEVMQDILATLHSTFKKTRIAITLDCPGDITLHSRPGLIGQVMTNLLTNSHKHGFGNGTREGAITIDVRHDREGGRLHIRYRDNGAGIRPEDLNNIFEPFFTTARESGGSGLGLTICYNIIHGQLRGEITCQSTPGKGVVFDIRVPMTSQG